MEQEVLQRLCSGARQGQALLVRSHRSLMEAAARKLVLLVLLWGCLQRFIRIVSVEFGGLKENLPAKQLFLFFILV